MAKVRERRASILIPARSAAKGLREGGIYRHTERDIVPVCPLLWLCGQIQTMIS
jgi:hypothetical protein